MDSSEAFLFKTPLKFWVCLIGSKKFLKKVLIFPSLVKARKAQRALVLRTASNNNYFKKISREILGILRTGKSVSFRTAGTSLTSFQKKVLKETSRIPRGCCITYRKLAEKLGRPEAARAVGQALKKNPWPILIPCHRVVGQKSLGGFSAGVRFKQKLQKMKGRLK